MKKWTLLVAMVAMLFLAAAGTKSSTAATSGQLLMHATVVSSGTYHGIVLETEDASFAKGEGGLFAVTDASPPINSYLDGSVDVTVNSANVTHD